MNCNDCLCVHCASADCSNYEVRVCDFLEFTHFEIQNPSCLVSECVGFKEKKGIEIDLLSFNDF